ncbi:hypothetical protein DH2020_003003 [Rehmannia glutinosa]|uniref:Uncharacterized protein n=1 Tax=Rehmannia glutinosa TaxID=99300 RepID=A0ABR0W3F3_REHGL
MRFARLAHRREFLPWFKSKSHAPLTNSVENQVKMPLGPVKKKSVKERVCGLLRCLRKRIASSVSCLLYHHVVTPNGRAIDAFLIARTFSLSREDNSALRDDISSPESSTASKAIVSGPKTSLVRNRPWKFTAVGLSGNNISDDNPFDKENLNGSVFDDDESCSPVPFGTVKAEITQETIDFFVSDAEGDPDRPSPGYSSIEQALVALRQEKFVLVVDDDESGTVEGNLVMAASHVSPKTIAFMVKHGSGIVSVGMKAEDLERLKLPLMSPENEDDSSAPSFTVTVDAKAEHPPVYQLQTGQKLS